MRRDISDRYNYNLIYHTFFVRRIVGGGIVGKIALRFSIT